MDASPLLITTSADRPPDLSQQTLCLAYKFYPVCTHQWLFCLLGFFLNSAKDSSTLQRSNVKIYCLTQTESLTKRLCLPFLYLSKRPPPNFE